MSGGCVENDILHTAAEVIAGAPFQVKRYGVADASAWEVGLPCGGEIAVMVQPVSAEGFDPELFDRIAEAREQGCALTVTTDLTTGRSDLRPVETGEVFANRYDPPRRLLIVGAVQIAQSLAQLAQTLGIATVVIDPRARFLTEERFPGVTLDDRWPDEAVAAYAPGPATAVVTLSHDTKIDDPLSSLRSPAIPLMSARWAVGAAMPRGGSVWPRWAFLPRRSTGSMALSASISVRSAPPRSRCRSRRR